MSLGTGIFLFVVGAILAFAVNIPLTWVDLHVIGYILMIAGVVVMIIGVVLLTRRRRSVSTSSSGIDPATGRRVDRQVTDTDDPIV
jgi:membrane-bound ClpP family serine protease